jgi:3-phosphoshikimate 1-carboxyvinyltransferase
MKKSARPSEISGTLVAPPSKSVMQRVVAAALLSDGITEIINPSFCDDSLAALRLAECLGAKVLRSKDRLQLKGGIKPRVRELDCGESGLCLRMFSAVAALSSQELMLLGKSTLCRRPVGMVEKPFQDLGVDCQSTDGFPPLRLKGPLRGGRTIVDGSVTSQFLTGLLLALPCADRESIIQVKNLKSKSYIDITLKIMDDFQVHVTHENYQKFFIEGNQRYQARKYMIEGDWSAASFLLVAGAIGGDVCLCGLDPDSAQGDKRILEALAACGAQVSIEKHSFQETNHRPDIKNLARIKVKAGNLNGFTFDATDCPDLFPPLVVLACACEGQTRIKGVERLSFKESNRAEVLKKEFSRLGASIRLNGDWMEIQKSRFLAGFVDSHHDHRIAMAAAIAGIIAQGEISIQGPACVSKSYPHFFKDFKKIGGKVHE